MDRRNEVLSAGQLFCVRKPDGSYYRVFSKEQLNRFLSSGKIEEDDIVQIISSITF